MSNVQVLLQVSEEEQGRRLDDVLSKRTGISRSEAVRMIEEDVVRVNGKKRAKGYLLQVGETIQLTRVAVDSQAAPPVSQSELPLEVLYEDAHMVIVNKPAGMPTHPLRPQERGTLASAIVARYPECSKASDSAREGGVCHRLDTDTSGVIVAARDPQTWRALRLAFSTGTVVKEYWALCCGSPQGDSGEVRLPMMPASGHRDRMMVADTPEQMYSALAMTAHTTFQVLQRHGGYSLLLVRAHTGRRHQIRAHLSYLGLPLCGDTRYGGGDYPNISGSPAELHGQFLHARRLMIPALSELGMKNPIDVSAPLPKTRSHFLQQLGFLLAK